ncbi:MAG: C4-type zinc ribbon domain-containing protein [Myxococcota bacterium]|jgi:predicted  nucleic acid-binding Zn-ribbon protein|nr:C4-type zinc ribbon domain-containing protein [Myxococcota bacterium]
MRNWDPKLFDQLNALQDLDLEARSLQNQIEEFTRKSKEEDPQIVQLKREASELEQRMSATSAQYQMYIDTLEDIRAAIAGMTSGKPGAIKARTRSSTEALKIEEEKLALLVQETASQLRLQDEMKGEISGKIIARSKAVETQQRGPEAEIRLLLCRIDELTKQRDLAAGGIPLELLRTYDRLSRSRSGIALTRLANGVCSVCRMEMPTAIVSRLKLGDTIPNCPACGRLVASVEFDETFESFQSKRAAVYQQEDEEEDDEEERPRRPVPLDEESDEEREPAAEDEDGEAGEDSEELPEKDDSDSSTGLRREGSAKVAKVGKSVKPGKSARSKIIEMTSAKSAASGKPVATSGKKKGEAVVTKAGRESTPPEMVAKAPEKAAVTANKPEKPASQKRTSQAPGKTTKPEKAAKTSPVKPSKPEKAPVKKAPAQKAPTKPSKPPGAPSKATKAPAKPAKAAVKTNKPSKASAKPKKPAKKAPAKPIKPTKAPAKPIKPTKAPAKPIKPTKAPAKLKKPAKAPAKLKKPAKAPAKPIKPTKAPAKPAKKAKKAPAKPSKPASGRGKSR